MKAIVSVYKSEIVDYIKENDLKEEDVIMICSNAEFLKAEADKKATDVVLLSAPMGVPMNYDFLRFALIDTETKPMPINEVPLDTPDDPSPKTGGGDMEPVIGGDKPSNEEEVKEILETPPAVDSPENVGSLKEALEEDVIPTPQIKDAPATKVGAKKKATPKKK